MCGNSERLRVAPLALPADDTRATAQRAPARKLDSMSDCSQACSDDGEWARVAPLALPADEARAAAQRAPDANVFRGWSDCRLMFEDFERLCLAPHASQFMVPAPWHSEQLHRSFWKAGNQHGRRTSCFTAFVMIWPGKFSCARLSSPQQLRLAQ